LSSPLPSSPAAQQVRGHAGISSPLAFLLRSFIAPAGLSLLALASASPVQSKPVDNPKRGVWGWTSGAQTYLRVRPSASDPAVAKVPRATKMFVWGKFNGWYRVETPDHKFGWVRHDVMSVPKAHKIAVLSQRKAAAASDRASNQTLYGSRDTLQNYYARHGSSGAKRGLAQHGVRVGSSAHAARPSKPAAKPATRVASALPTKAASRLAASSTTAAVNAEKIAPKVAAKPAVKLAARLDAPAASKPRAARPVVAKGVAARAAAVKAATKNTAARTTPAKSPVTRTVVAKTPAARPSAARLPVVLASTAPAASTATPSAKVWSSNAPRRATAAHFSARQSTRSMSTAGKSPSNSRLALASQSGEWEGGQMTNAVFASDSATPSFPSTPATSVRPASAPHSSAAAPAAKRAANPIKPRGVRMAQAVEAAPHAVAPTASTAPVVTPSPVAAEATAPAGSFGPSFTVQASPSAPTPSVSLPTAVAPRAAKPAAKQVAAKPLSRWQKRALARRNRQTWRQRKLQERRLASRNKLRSNMGMRPQMRMGVPPVAPPSARPISPSELLRAREEFLAGRAKSAPNPFVGQSMNPERSSDSSNSGASASESATDARVPNADPSARAVAPASWNGTRLAVNDSPTRPAFRAGSPRDRALIGQPASRPAANTYRATVVASRGPAGRTYRGGSPRDALYAGMRRAGSPRDAYVAGRKAAKFEGSLAGQTMASQALTYRGTPYRSGGASPRGFDCSGLVYFLLRQRGQNPPRTAAGLAGFGQAVDRSDLQKGDVVLFANTYKRGVSHAGVYVGDGKFVHAPHSGSRVRTDVLFSGYYGKKYYGARRAR
jgi:cell wall-associated NlpC family hydrolase